MLSPIIAHNFPLARFLVPAAQQENALLTCNAADIHPLQAHLNLEQFPNSLPLLEPLDLAYLHDIAVLEGRASKCVELLAVLDERQRDIDLSGVEFGQALPLVLVDAEALAVLGGALLRNRAAHDEDLLARRVDCEAELGAREVHLRALSVHRQ